MGGFRLWPDSSAKQSQELQGANNIRYDLLMAGAVIASLPVIVLYLVAQRWVIEGISRSGLKG
ncbi:hypothetical protein [Streptosporangium canum]|uniref:hypothetical protein n=1 Tax=Streptosporangium canum TaxID=324952 RepID=UPI000B866BB1|nr:hypothetical protein [Streptosporangium canum]